jgi:hypothetical protein
MDMNGDQWISWLRTNHNINHNIFIISFIMWIIGYGYGIKKEMSD